MTSARAGKGRSFRRPSTTSSRPSAAAPATRGRLVNRAVSVNVFRTLQNMRKIRKIILIRFHVLCYLLLRLLCTSTNWLDETSGSLVQQKVDTQVRYRYGKATVGKRKVLRTLRLRREAVQSLVDTSDHSEVRLQSDQLGLINCFHEAPFGGKLPRGWILWQKRQGLASSGLCCCFFSFFFFYKAHDVQQKKKERKKKSHFAKTEMGKVKLTLDWALTKGQARLLSEQMWKVNHLCFDGERKRVQKKVKSNKERYPPVKWSLRHSKRKGTLRGKK